MLQHPLDKKQNLRTCRRCPKAKLLEFPKLSFRKAKVNKNGFVTLLFVLIVFAAGMAISTALIISGVASSQNSFLTNQSDQAKALADACAERGLENIRDDNGFAGTVNLPPFGAGSCQYIVSNPGGSNRIVNASGTVGAVVRKVRVTVYQINPIKFSSWQEVAD